MNTASKKSETCTQFQTSFVETKNTKNILIAFDMQRLLKSAQNVLP